jgi:hypothetical protein
MVVCGGVVGELDPEMGDGSGKRNVEMSATKKK